MPWGIAIPKDYEIHLSVELDINPIGLRLVYLRVSEENYRQAISNPHVVDMKFAYPKKPGCITQRGKGFLFEVKPFDDMPKAKIAACSPSPCQRQEVQVLCERPIRLL